MSKAGQSLLDIIPGLREAVERERFNRVSPFLGLPETVCGIECRPLTLLDLLRLDCAGSPFVVGGAVAATDVLAFFKLQCTKRSKFAEWRMLRRLGWRTNTAQAAKEISAFITDAFADAPPSSASGESPAYWSVAQDYLHVFGNAYGWSPEITLNQPLKALFPQLSVIRYLNNPAAPMFNPISDRVRGEWLREVNRN